MLVNQTYSLSPVETKMLAFNKQPPSAGISSRPLKIYGDFCVETFLESYAWLADKHPVLKIRYEFDLESGDFVKVLGEPAIASFQDYSARDEIFVNQKLIELSRADFDIQKDHLFMVHLMKCDESTFVLYMKSFHVFSDALTCLKILQNTLEAYHALKTTGSFSNIDSDGSPSHYVRFEEEFATNPKNIN